MEPCRARPVPFCLYGFSPPPLTSPRVLVECVPWRAAASWATTTWWMSGTLVWTPNSSSGSSAVPAALPSASTTSIVTLAMTSGPLRGGLDEHDGAPRARDGALDEEQAALGVDRVDGQVLGGLPDGAHAARHAHALEDAARGGARADRTRRAVLALGAGGGAGGLETGPLHDTRGALALGPADDVDLLAGLEDLGRDLLAGRVLAGVRRAD